jgi:hypothetical protein
LVSADRRSLPDAAHDPSVRGRVVDLVNTNEIAGVTHEYVGQEAVATGVCAALRVDDVIPRLIAGTVT